VFHKPPRCGGIPNIDRGSIQDSRHETFWRIPNIKTLKVLRAGVFRIRVHMVYRRFEACSSGAMDIYWRDLTKSLCLASESGLWGLVLAAEVDQCTSHPGDFRVLFFHQH
jgi:hypothetical protein